MHPGSLIFFVKGGYNAPPIDTKIKKGNGNEDAKTECPNDNPALAKR
jgi:hypothetical protein